MIKNVTIVNFHHDDNKGDSAIILSSIQNLTRQGHGLKFTVISQFRNQKGREFRHLRHFFGNKIKYKKSLVPRLDEFVVWMPIYIIRVFAWSFFITTSLIKDVVSYLIKKEEREPIKDSDLLLFSGGQFMYNWNFFYWPMFLFHLYSLILGILYKVPCVIHCISVPKTSPSFLMGSMLKILFNRCKIVAVREIGSKNTLLKLGVNKSLIKIVPDPAFLLARNVNFQLGKIGKKYNLKKKQYITLTICEGKHKSNKYFSEINLVIKELVKKHRIVLLATSIGPEQNEDDRLLIKQVTNSFDNKNLIAITDDLSPIECQKIIANSLLLIGTRFHSLIFGLGAKIPVIAISYSPKTINTFKMLGYSNFIIETHNIKGSKILFMAKKILENNQSLRKTLANNLKTITNEVDNYNRELTGLLQ